MVNVEGRAELISLFCFSRIFRRSEGESEFESSNGSYAGDKDALVYLMEEESSVETASFTDEGATERVMMGASVRFGYS